MNTVYITEVPNIQVDTPECSALKDNKMKCTRNAQYKIDGTAGVAALTESVRIAGGMYFCAEHKALLILRGKKEGFEVKEI